MVMSGDNHGKSDQGVWGHRAGTDGHGIKSMGRNDGQTQLRRGKALRQVGHR